MQVFIRSLENLKTLTYTEIDIINSKIIMKLGENMYNVNYLISAVYLK